MSKYFIEGETLTDIADQLRLELDTTQEYPPEDMPLAIHLAASQGGGGTEENEMELISEGNVADVLVATKTTYGTDSPQYQSMVFRLLDGVIYDEVELYLTNSSGTALTINSSGAKVDTAIMRFVEYNLPQHWSSGTVGVGGVSGYSNYDSLPTSAQPTMYFGTYGNSYLTAKYFEDGRAGLEVATGNGGGYAVLRRLKLLTDHPNAASVYRVQGLSGYIAIQLQNANYFNPATVATYKLYGRRRKNN